MSVIVVCCGIVGLCGCWCVGCVWFGFWLFNSVVL